MSKGKIITGAIAGALAIATPFVAKWEGLRTDPYKDIGGVMTVCYGETNIPMRKYTPAECEAMLRDSLGGYAKGVLERNPNLKDRPFQLAAASSLAYNIGVSAYRGSTVARRFTQGDYKGACDAFLMWRFVGKKEVKGLLNRRKAEREICLRDL